MNIDKRLCGMTFALAILTSIGLLSGCNGASPAPDDQTDTSSHLETILERGQLTMLCYPSLEGGFVDFEIEALQETGLTLAELRDPKYFSGDDIDRIRAFAEFLGIGLEVLPITTGYSDLIKAVAEGRGDLAASSLSITSERLRLVDFSIPIGATWAVVAVPLDSDVSSLKDLIGKKGAAMKGSSQLEVFGREAPEGIELQLTSFNLESYAMIEEGKVDFILMDSDAPVSEPARNGFEQVKVAFRLERTDYGIALPKGSDLLPRLNEFLALSDSSPNPR